MSELTLKLARELNVAGMVSFSKIHGCEFTLLSMVTVCLEKIIWPHTFFDGIYPEP